MVDVQYLCENDRQTVSPQIATPWKIGNKWKHLPRAMQFATSSEI